LKFIEDNVPGQTAEGIWKQIEDIAVKTLIAAQP